MGWAQRGGRRREVATWALGAGHYSPFQPIRSCKQARQSARAVRWHALGLNLSDMMGVRSKASGVKYSGGGTGSSQNAHNRRVCEVASAGTGKIAFGEWTSGKER